MRIPLIAGNWKMNTTVSEAIKLVNGMRLGLDEISGIEKVICPPFVSLVPVRELIKGTSIKLGAQNMYFEKKGAFTGEISPLMLAELCEYVIIGHSERRQYFSETGELISKKVLAALETGMKPVLCIGERLADYEAGKTEKVVTEQLKSSLTGVSNLGALVMAYEPVWAIGTGRAATGKLANEAIGLIRRLIAESYNKKIAENMRILYGGSVTAQNIREFVEQPEIDGALVGGASLKPSEFISIVRQTSEIRTK